MGPELIKKIKVSENDTKKNNYAQEDDSGRLYILHENI